jgi:hypothetical protein
MKITVITKSNNQVNTMNVCPWLVDMPPVSNRG